MPQVETSGDAIETIKSTGKCRIPTRLPGLQQRMIPLPKPRVPIENPKNDLVSVTSSRCASRIATRGPRYDETRPKSANRVKEELGLGKMTEKYIPRTARQNFAATKKVSTIPNKIPTRPPHITVPQIQRLHGKTVNITEDLPDQETIQKHEDLEVLQQTDSFEEDSNVFAETELLNSRSDRSMPLKIKWQEHIVQFQKMKNDLGDRQEALIELYADMRNIYQKLVSSGQKVNLPAAEELRLMNIHKLNPEQLLQICSLSHSDEQPKKGQTKSFPIIDMNKLYNMPSKLIATCEETLTKRKEIIQWFEMLSSKEKSVSMSVLTKKTNEFTVENEMLKSSLERAKEDIIKELDDFVQFVRKTVNETMALQLRTENMTYQLSELNSQNMDLRKQIQNHDHLRPNTNKNKIEELEKELKEERCKRLISKDRLTRAEGQVKINAERACQLETALEQARSQIWNLERTVQQLHEQNKKLQQDFDIELTKLRESITENTSHLEEIAKGREKLENEKEDLEKRLVELSKYYNESLSNVKHDMNINIGKLIEIEKKYELEAKNRKAQELKVASLSDQLSEAENLHKVLRNQLQEKEKILNDTIDYEKILRSTKQELDSASSQLDEYKIKVSKQDNIFAQMERDYKESHHMGEKLRCNLMAKEEYITEMEKKQSLLEEQLKESQNKMESYEKQLISLKNQFYQLQEDFGEFENFSELHDMVNQQRVNFLEVTRQNGELVEALQTKEKELVKNLHNLEEQKHLLEQREAMIKMLSEKSEEQTNIIELLQNKVEMKTHGDVELKQQITEKDAAIQNLISNVEARKQQISQLEKIILTLEDQKQKCSYQMRKDEDKIKVLEQTIAEYEAYHLETRHIDIPSNDVDSLIKIFEDELGTSFDAVTNTDHSPKTKYIQRRKQDKYENYDNNERINNPILRDPENIPTKIVMGNFVKKTYISKNDERFKGNNNPFRKKSITNIDSQKCLPVEKLTVNEYVTPPVIKDNNYPPFRGLLPAGSHIKSNLLSRNIQLLNGQQWRDDKQNKMFKFAGHKL